MPTNRTGLKDLARLPSLNTNELIALMTLYLRRYERWSMVSAKVTGELLVVRRGLRDLRTHVSALSQVSAAPIPDHDRRHEELQDLELELDSSQRHAERKREIYEKTLAAVMRILDLRRAELQLRKEECP